MKTSFEFGPTTMATVEVICEETGKTADEFISEAVQAHIEKVSRELGMDNKREEVLWKRAMDAAERCLESKGYEVLAREYDVADIVALDGDGTLCFICLQVAHGVEEERMPMRSRMESAALHYMCEEEWEEGTPVRFDNITLMIAGGSKAMVRHHLGAYDKEVA